MQKKILLTRPRAASERWAALLAQHGFTCLIAPLLTIESLRAKRPEGLFQACFITSANALEALRDAGEALADLLPLPCFCVGAATGDAARLFGFTDIRCGASNSAALARNAAATLVDRNRPLLHIAGDVVDGKARGILAGKGFTLTPWAVYRAHAVEDLPPAARAAIQAGDIGFVPVFSPRSARILVSLLEKSGLSGACSGIVAVGLSQAVANVLKILPWRHLRVAARPSEEEVLACLKREFSMTPADPTPEPATAATASRCLRGKIFFAWAFLGILLLAAAGGLAFVKYPRPSSPPILRPSPVPGIAAPERRAEIPETRAAAPAQPPVAAVPAVEAQTPPDDQPLADAVKNLQAQVAQLQNRDKDSQQSARRLVAAAFAFLDVRDAAMAGRPFAGPLAVLRDAATGDAVLAGKAAALESYSTAPPPTLAALRSSLAETEAALPPQQSNPSLWERVRAVAQPLISMHPLHDPRFADLEKSLDSGDAQRAVTDFKALPGDVQEKLAAWHAGLEARAGLDAAVDALEASFAAPAVRKDAP